MAEMLDVDALMAEASGEPFQFKFGGDVYTLPFSPDMRAIAAMSAGRLDDALRMMLGADQWERLQQVDAVFDTRALQAIMDGYASHVGVNLPNSSGSTGSSSSMVKPSKRTSNGSTRPR